MNKYLLISALFGFVFNSFVFGYDRYNVPLNKCVIKYKGKDYTTTSTNIVEVRKCAEYFDLDVLGDVDFKNSNGSVFKKPLTYKCKSTYVEKECKYLLEVKPYLSVTFEFHDGLQPNGKLSGYKEIKESESYRSFRNEHSDYTCNLSVSELVNTYIDLITSGDNCCCTSDDFDVKVSYFSPHDGGFDRGLSTIVSGDLQGEEIYTNCIFFEFHKKDENRFNDFCDVEACDPFICDGKEVKVSISDCVIDVNGGPVFTCKNDYSVESAGIKDSDYEKLQDIIKNHTFTNLNSEDFRNFMKCDYDCEYHYKKNGVHCFCVNCNDETIINFALYDDLEPNDIYKDGLDLKEDRNGNKTRGFGKAFGTFEYCNKSVFELIDKFKNMLIFGYEECFCKNNDFFVDVVYKKGGVEDWGKCLLTDESLKTCYPKEIAFCFHKKSSGESVSDPVGVGKGGTSASAADGVDPTKTGSMIGPKTGSEISGGGSGMSSKIGAGASFGKEIKPTKIGGGKSGETGGSGVGTGEKDMTGGGKKGGVPMDLSKINFPNFGGGSGSSGTGNGSNSKPKKKRCGCKCSGK